MTHRDREWLEDALDAFDLLYFDGQLEALGIKIRWHTFRSKGQRSRFGEAHFVLKTVRINRVLAQAWVPDYFVLDVVHHELLHFTVSPEHDLAFRLSEERFVHHAKACVWEALHAGEVLAATALLSKSKSAAAHKT